MLAVLSQPVYASQQTTIAIILYKCTQDCYDTDLPTSSMLSMFSDMCAADADLWADADMPSVVKYLRGCADLNMPDVWRSVFPRKL